MTILKIPSLIIFLLFLFGTFEGCISNQNKTVGLLLHQQDDRWSMDVKYLTEYFQNEGVKLIIKDAEGDENRQIKQAEELVQEGIGVILIVAVNQNTAAGIVRIAHENRIKVVGYDRLIKNADLDYLLSFEYKQIGTDLAKYAHNKVPKGNYVLLWGDASDDNARVMQKAQMEYLQPYIDAGDINVVYKAYIEHWSYENALHKMNKILDFSDKKIDVVLANNDRLAVGALDALKAHDYTHSVLITGHDATLEACRLIAQGEVSMTIYKPLSELAKEAVSLSIKILNQEKIKVGSTVYNGRIQVPAILLTPIVVDSMNLKETVIKDKLHSYRDIYE